MTESIAPEETATESRIDATDSDGAGTVLPLDEHSVSLPRGEIVIGLVSALGTDLSGIELGLRTSLRGVGYSTRHVRVSALLRDAYELSGLPALPKSRTKLDELMDLGDELRRRLNQGSAGAALAVMAISNERHGELQGSTDSPERPAVATLIRQLKHPDEVELLRSVYGPRFVLLGAWAPRTERRTSVDEMLRRLHPEKDDPWYAKHVTRLLRRDEKDGLRKLGQRVRDTFQLADAYVAVRPGRPVADELRRFVRLLFGAPFETPSADEQAMYQAAGARFRSSAAGRQVGAVIVDRLGELLVSGTNDAPKPHGGQYWAGDEPDFRDFQYGYDFNDRQKLSIITDLLRRLKRAGWLNTGKSGKKPGEIARRALDDGGCLRDSRVGDLLEFGRILHAEMAAICTAARRGTPIGGETLFTTTYPCHECARLIIGSGIARVVYIDPYPKSQVPAMYRDEVTEGPTDSVSGVVFEPFQGIAPRLYGQVFAMPSRLRDEITGDYLPWDAESAPPRLVEDADMVSPLQSMEDSVIDRIASDLEGLV